MLDRFVFRTRRAIRLRDTVNVLVTTSGDLRSLNRQFRGIDKPTDVLSFPSPEVVPGRARQPAGEIAISADVARENAKRLGHSLAEEVKILALHGIMHLAGFDHERDHGEMAREESRLRRQFKLESALIERNQPRPDKGSPSERTSAKPVKKKKNRSQSRGRRRSA